MKNELSFLVCEDLDVSDTRNRKYSSRSRGAIAIDHYSHPPSALKRWIDFVSNLVSCYFCLFFILLPSNKYIMKEAH